MKYNIHDRKSIAITAIIITAISAIGIGALATNLGNQDVSYPYQQLPTSGSEAESLDTATYRSDTERKRATTVDISLNVKDINRSQNQIINLVNQEGGFITSNSIENNNQDTGRLEFRIPESNTSNVLSGIEKLGNIESRRTNVDDVTDQYDQVETELKNRRQELQKLEELMNQTSNVSELIQVQERMSEVRSRIDYLEQRKTRLDNRIEYTAVSITLSEPATFDTDFELRQTLTKAYKEFFNSLNLIIIGLAYLTPIILLLSMGAGIRKMWLKRFD